MPKISVIVPVYNVENYIEKCIESIFSQTYTDFELLLINDGSSDKSGSICDAYVNKDERIRVFHKKNEGVSIARNLGIKRSLGEWICFVDSDDWVENLYLEKFVENKELDEDTMVSQGIMYDFISSSDENFPFFIYPDKICAEEEFADLFTKYNLLHNGCPVSKLYNKNLLVKKSIYFNPSISTHEDHLFVLTYLLYCKKIILSSSIPYHYMIRNELSLSTKYHTSEELIEVSRLLIEKIIQCKSKYHFSQDCFNRAISAFGLRQLLVAARNSHQNNYHDVFAVLRDRKELFLNHFVAKNLTNSLFLVLLFNNVPDCFLYRLIRLQRNLKKLL